MNNHGLALKEIAEAFRLLQKSRDVVATSDPELKASIERCMQLVALIIADVQEKANIPDGVGQ